MITYYFFVAGNWAFYNRIEEVWTFKKINATSAASVEPYKARERIGKTNLHQMQKKKVLQKKKEKKAQPMPYVAKQDGHLYQLVD